MKEHNEHEVTVSHHTVEFIDPERIIVRYDDEARSTNFSDRRGVSVEIGHDTVIRLSIPAAKDFAGQILKAAEEAGE